jgi:hypothetical protein
MALVDPNIAMGYRGIEVPNQLAQYGQLAQIQNAQNQNQLAQYQLGAAQRAEAKDISRIQLIFGFDDADQVGLDHFKTVIQPYLDKHDVSYEAQAFKSMGYAGLNRYYNHLAKSADADWLFVWNDDAVMDTVGWDTVISQHTGQFRLLKLHTHNDHPYSIFPIVPRAWFETLGLLSRHQMIDAEVSQIAFMLDIMQVIDVHATHNQVELTKDANDPLKPKNRFEGNPNSPQDFHYIETIRQRHVDCGTLMAQMLSLGDSSSLTWWNNVRAGIQDPWEKLKLLDVNKQMSQYRIKLP